MSTTAIIFLAIIVAVILLSLGLSGVRRFVFLVGAIAVIVLAMLIVDGKLTLGQITSTVRQFWERQPAPDGNNSGTAFQRDGKNDSRSGRTLTDRLNSLGESLRSKGPSSAEDREDLLAVQDVAAPSLDRVAALRRLVARGTSLTDNGRPFDETALRAFLNQ